MAALVFFLTIAFLTTPFYAAESGSCSGDANGWISANSPCVDVMGRVAVAPFEEIEAEAGSLLFDWPGVVVTIGFTGTSLGLQLKGDQVGFEACVDEVCRRITTTNNLKLWEIATDLEPGEHWLKLSKLGETIGSHVEFKGVVVDQGQQLLASLPPKQRQIEIIGDSYSVGYGAESPGWEEAEAQSEAGRNCDDQQLRHSTNTQRAQGVVAAKILDADFQVVAFSGLGLVRAYNGNRDFLTFPFYYPRLLMNHYGRAYHPQNPEVGTVWQPEAVVVALGTNDFSTAIQPHEANKFSNRRALQAAYLKEYSAFLKMLRQRYPEAQFFLISTNLGNGNELFEAIQALIAEEAKRGNRDLHHLFLPAETMYGCHWHPDLADHARNGRLLAQEVSRVLGWGLQSD